MRRLERMIGLTTGPDVLDIGFTGPSGVPRALHVLLRERFPALAAIDFNADQITNLELPNTFAADAQDFDLGTRFDTIVAGELIEHLENPALFLRASRRHLKEEGRLVVSTPYAFGLAHVIYAWWKFPKTCSNPEHVSWFCPRTLTALAEREGFRVETLELIFDPWSDPPDVVRDKSNRLVAGKGGGGPRWDSFMRILTLVPLPKRMKATNIIAVLVPT